MELTQADYVRWRALWDEMMRQYCPARDTAFALALDLMAQLVKGPALQVMDVCCGAGTFVEQVLARFPHARACTSPKP
jgi:trans-aconitate methyltransferase